MSSHSRDTVFLPPAQLTSVERGLSYLTVVRPGEGRSAALFFVYAFLLLVCYYVLKTVREPLLLANGPAALKSYGYGATAGVLLVLVPLYHMLFRHLGTRALVRLVTVSFAASLPLFYGAGRAGAPIGFVYYVWVGVFGVMMLTQFWAHAAHCYGFERGRRLFPAIMAGAAMGALVGPALAGALYEELGAWNLMLAAAGLLLATVPLVERTSRAVPAESGGAECARPVPCGPEGGLTTVLRDRYLLLLAAVTVLLNCVSSTGEFLLTELVLEDADRRASEGGLEKHTLIAAFYGDYYFVTNALGLILQLLLVARLFRRLGMRGVLLVSPLIALVGYGMALVVPAFALVRALKVVENSTNYTLMNTARHMLYLPLPVTHQYVGKTAVDTFCWRFGDLLQAAIIFVGLNWLGFGFRQFALLNVLLAAAWLAIALRIGVLYPREQAAPRPCAAWRSAAGRRPATVAACSAAVALAAVAFPRHVRAEVPLFAEDAPLVLELRTDLGALCRSSDRAECPELAAELVYRGNDGSDRTINVAVRARGRWRNDRNRCAVPPLFVTFRGDTSGTPFAGQSSLPLTTHCRERPADYEQYVLKEYLAYRIFNTLTDKSLRVRLARIRYHATGRRPRTVERFAFFTEHFESLAARHGAVLESGDLEPAEANPHELATLELFEYLIGNTDWSAVASHNVVHVRGGAGMATPIPYDFDFSGLVNASYAEPSAQLPIRSVTQRLYRGFCHRGLDWDALFAAFLERRGAIESLTNQVPDLEPKHRDRVRAFLADFFAIIASSERRAERIVESCRPIRVAE